MPIHRDIWIKNFGEIPKDPNGRTYEIHHRDGNNKNNSIENLMCISIDEHYKIHMEQGDYGAAALISKRMGLPVDHMSKIQLGKPKPNIVGKCGPKRGSIPWNKNKPGYKLNTNRKGKRFSSKISMENVLKIREDYSATISLDGVESIGKNGKNGVPITYKTLFCEAYAKKFNLTKAAVRKIVEGKTWKEGVVDVRS